MFCWKLKVIEYEHGEDESVTNYYASRELAVQHGFEIIKKVLLEVAGWDGLFEEEDLIEHLRNAEEAFYLMTSIYNEITGSERESQKYQFLDDNNLSITLKLITIIDSI